MQAAALSFAAGAAEVAAELVGGVRAHARDIFPWVFFYFALHALVEFAAPRLLGADIFDALGRKEARRARLAGAAARAPDRAALARTARTMVVSVVMALHVVALSTYGLLASASVAELGGDLYRETPLTRHLLSVATGCASRGARAVSASRRGPSPPPLPLPRRRVSFYLGLHNLRRRRRARGVPRARHRVPRRLCGRAAALPPPHGVRRAHVRGVDALPQAA